ncbi:MAG: efflux RND transporter periplasmic adaptor subunit [Chloroflexota bacterium]
MKRFMQIGIPILLIVAIVGVVFILQQEPVSAQSDANVITIEERDIDVIIDGTGIVSPERTLYLTFAVAETVAEVNVIAGDTVTEGDVLATLETASLQLQVDSAQADVNLAQANLDSAMLSVANSDAQVVINCASLDAVTDSLDMATDAYDDYVDAGYDVDPNFTPDPNSQAGIALRDAQTNYDVTIAQCNTANNNASNSSGVDASQAQLDNAEIRLEQAQDLLNDAQLIAPFDGLVTDVAIVEDQFVGTNTVAITLIDNSQLHVITRVDELDIANIEISQAVSVTLDALGEETIITGEVTRISPQAINNQGITNYEVRVDLMSDDARIRLGMSADVNIEIAVIDNALVVPRRAIQRNNDLGEFITLSLNGSNTDVAITPGYSADGYIVVEGDISAGQTVIIVED